MHLTKPATPGNKRLITVQAGAWYASILQAIGYLFTFMFALLALCRMSHKKKMQRVRDSMAMEQGYSQNTDVDRVYNPGDGRKYMPLTGGVSGF